MHSIIIINNIQGDKLKMIELMEIIKDPRQEGKVKHPLENILFITICAVICGADTWEEIADFGTRKKEWLSKRLKLPNNLTPSEDTFARFFHAVNPKEFEEYFVAWVNLFLNKNSQEKDIIPIDGKTVRGSYDKKSGKAAIHMVSAWSTMHSCVLGQVRTDDKSNEITAIPKLLKMLDINDSIVTIDAMGTQKKIASDIIEGGGDYILPVKGNQSSLEKEISTYFEDNLYMGNTNSNIYSFVEEENSRDRHEIRKYMISGELNSISERSKWQDIRSIGMTESHRTIDGETSVTRKYYIASIKGDIKMFSKATRKHWAIENSLHWCLDVAFREDECRIRKGNASENIAIVRHIAMNLLKNEKSSKKGIKRKRFNAAIDSGYLEKILRF
jgi:predicted transposase YbfD/YdcC